MADDHDGLVGFVTVQERHRTIRTGMICGTILAVSIVAGFVLVRIYTHSVWLEIVGWLIGPTGLVTILLVWYLRRVSRKVDKATQRFFPPSPQGNGKAT